jgi:signal recognition particle receptor subunit beta
VILWDLYGEDDFQIVRWSHLQGATGYLLVADGTRPSTLEQAYRMHDRIEKEIGPQPSVFVLNKFDLHDEWKIADFDLQSLKERGWPVLKSSAKTGGGVEDAFVMLASKMLR